MIYLSNLDILVYKLYNFILRVLKKKLNIGKKLGKSKLLFFISSWFEDINIF